MLKAIHFKKIFLHSVLTCFQIPLLPTIPWGHCSSAESKTLTRNMKEDAKSIYHWIIRLLTIKNWLFCGNSFTSLFIITLSVMYLIKNKKTITINPYSQTWPSSKGYF